MTPNGPSQPGSVSMDRVFFCRPYRAWFCVLSAPRECKNGLHVFAWLDFWHSGPVLVCSLVFGDPCNKLFLPRYCKDKTDCCSRLIEITSLPSACMHRVKCSSLSSSQRASLDFKVDISFIHNTHQ